MIRNSTNNEGLVCSQSVLEHNTHPPLQKVTTYVNHPPKMTLILTHIKLMQIHLLVFKSYTQV